MEELISKLSSACEDIRGSAPVFGFRKEAIYVTFLINSSGLYIEEGDTQDGIKISFGQADMDLSPECDYRWDPEKDFLGNMVEVEAKFYMKLNRAADQGEAKLMEARIK